MHLISQIYFWNRTLHVSYSSSVHHQQFFTVHTAVVYVTLKFNKWLICQIYFWNKTLHVSDSSSVHHQQFFTVHAAMVYIYIYIYHTACERDQDGTSFILTLLASCQQTCMTYTIAC